MLSRPMNWILLNTGTHFYLFSIVSKTLHAVDADKAARLQVTLAEAGRVLRERFNVYECTIQMERYVDERLQCSQCQENCG